MGVRCSDSPIVVGSVISDRAYAHRLAVCLFIRKVLFSRASLPDVVHFWNMCCMDKAHCGSGGRRLKFKPCFGGVCVAWVCPKVVGLPLECV